ncbi:TNT domain-containing protein [Mycolicibacterium chitae]|uniref:TNT domain-containing protein n=1 Tax=Mycolicibacterium chitae TaxID=1792 RepID=UPI001476EFCB|nr:TNT domain-containing protein [Mycolicibacterium chitae]
MLEGYDPTPPGPNYTTTEGSLIYPDDSLPSKPYALPGTVIENVQLPHGTPIDRFGFPGGGWLSPEGVAFAERALPPDSVSKPYYRFIVDDPGKLPPGYSIEQSQAAPWFHQPGGGVQYRIVDPKGNTAAVQDLIDAQYLREVRG